MDSSSNFMQIHVFQSHKNTINVLNKSKNTQRAQIEILLVSMLLEHLKIAKIANFVHMIIIKINNLPLVAQFHQELFYSPPDFAVLSCLVILK